MSAKITRRDWNKILLVGQCEWSDKSWRILGYFLRAGGRPVQVQEISDLLEVEGPSYCCGAGVFMVINAIFRKRGLPYRLSLVQKPGGTKLNHNKRHYLLKKA